MDSFEFNKIAAAVLITLLVFLGVRNLGDLLYAPDPADPKAFIVEVAETDGATPAAAKEAVVPIGDLLLTASVEKGARIAKKCVSCHSFEPGGAHRIGPALWGVAGRAVAPSNGFSYSAALAELGGVWDAEALDGFLTAPKKYAKGTSMAFVGLRKPGDRADIISYLNSLQ